MCDKAEYRKLRDEVARLKAADAAQTEQIKTLFGAVGELKNTARYIMIACLSVLSLVIVISLLALVWCAVGPNGYQAVTHGAKELAPTISTN